jgi:hypothetical protein
MTWDRRLYVPSEGRLAVDFYALKNPTASAGFEPANLGTKGQHATSRPPKLTTPWLHSSHYQHSLSADTLMSLFSTAYNICLWNLSFHLSCHLSHSFLAKKWCRQFCIHHSPLRICIRLNCNVLDFIPELWWMKQENVIDIRDIQQVWFPRSQKLNEKSLHQT